jgi:hypothetical protein
MSGAYFLMFHDVGPLLAQYLGPAIFATAGPSCSLVYTSVAKHNNNRNWQMWFLGTWGHQCSQWFALLLPESFRALYSFFCDATLNLQLLPLDWQTLFFLAEVRYGEKLLIPPSVARRRLDRRVFPYADMSFHVQEESLRHTCMQLYDQDSNCYNRNRTESFGDALQLSWYVCQRGHIAKLLTLKYDGGPAQIYSLGDKNIATLQFGFDFEVEFYDGFCSCVELECPCGNPQNFTLSVSLNIDKPDPGSWISQEDEEQYLAELRWAVV